MTSFCNILTVLCLTGPLMFMLVDANSVRRDCHKKSLHSTISKLINQTQTKFLPAFPTEKMHNVKLLTNNVRKDYFESCNARNQLMLFYHKILKNSQVIRRANEHNILDDFMSIHLKLPRCYTGKCTEDKAEVKSIKELQKKYNEFSKKRTQMLLKAVSEFQTLLYWINCVVVEEDADECQY